MEQFLWYYKRCFGWVLPNQVWQFISKKQLDRDEVYNELEKRYAECLNYIKQLSIEIGECEAQIRDIEQMKTNPPYVFSALDARKRIMVHQYVELINYENELWIHIRARKKLLYDTHRIVA